MPKIVGRGIKRRARSADQDQHSARLLPARPGTRQAGSIPPSAYRDRTRAGVSGDATRVPALVHPGSGPSFADPLRTGPPS
jgi:hypothetical protein